VEDVKPHAQTEKLAIDGGEPVRVEPLPLEFPGAHSMDDAEVEAAVRVLKSRSLFRYYGMNPQGEVEAFEREFARFAGVKHALAVGSGTGALHAATAAFGIGPGREVIVPAYLWVSVVAAVVNRGAIPVLADIDDSFCLDPAGIERLITPRTAGIVFIHMSGAPGDVRPVRDIARRHGLWLLEDCAQCAGGTLDGQKVGSFGDMAIYSFQMNKNMTSGEGGCVLTNDSRLYRRAFACHDLGYARDENGRLVFNDPDARLWGMGCRLDELRAAVLRVQLEKLPGIACAMRRSKARIRAALAEMPGITLRRLPDPAGGAA
jgi:8-amino-3,8-dideoxy-alpha-D-manno-octulosonate transaminase